MGLFGSPKVDTSYQDFQMEEAARARAEEEARQARIAEGMRRIQAIFEGGTFTPGAPTEVGALNQSIQAGYDRIFGPQAAPAAAPAAPTGFFNRAAVPQSAPTTPAAPAAPRPMAATETFEGMAPLLAQREQAQMDFYLPQLDNQKSDAEKQLTFALARAGLLNSTTAGTRQADLGQDFALERGAVLSRIASDLSGKKTWLNQQRATIESGLRASGDQTGATNQALSAMTSFSEDQPTMNPLGHLFAGVSEGIGSAQRGAEAERIRRTYGADPLQTRSGRLVNA